MTTIGLPSGAVVGSVPLEAATGAGEAGQDDGHRRRAGVGSDIATVRRAYEG